MHSNGDNRGGWGSKSEGMGKTKHCIALPTHHMVKQEWQDDITPPLLWPPFSASFVPRKQDITTQNSLGAQPFGPLLLSPFLPALRILISTDETFHHQISNRQGFSGYLNSSPGFGLPLHCGGHPNTLTSFLLRDLSKVRKLRQ